MLTVQIRDAGKVLVADAEVEILCDVEGLALLGRQLEHLNRGSTHVHLMTPTWGGNELGEMAIGDGVTVVNHLRIAMLPK